MVGTKRTPLARHPTMLVTPLAVELFVQQGRLRCSCNGCGSCASCDEWYRLDSDIHTELGLPPHEWPAAARQSPRGCGPPCHDEDTARRMELLNEAVRARRMNGARS